MNPSALHVFDMDGTLLAGAATVELARHFGQLEAGQQIEARFVAGTISDDGFWQGMLDIIGDAADADIAAAFSAAPWLAGIEETFSDIQERGEMVIVISQSPVFFVQGLRAWGAHETHGSPIDLGVPLVPGSTLSAEAKVAITAATLARLGLEPDDCVAYGDSGSDAGLFRWLDRTVAVNATETISGLAAAIYRGDDLRQAYALGRELLDARIKPGVASA